MREFQYITLAFLCYSFRYAEGANILLFHSLGSFSHKVSMYPVADAMAKRGHNVTYISGLNLVSKPNPNVRDIFVPAIAAFMHPILEENFNIQTRTDKTMGLYHDIIYPMELEGCKLFLTSPEFKSWLANAPKIDLVVHDFMGECGLAVAYKLGAKLVVYNTFPFNEKLSVMLGLPFESSTTDGHRLFIPSDYEPSAFMTRMNAAITGLLYEYRQYQYVSEFEELFKTALGFDNFPSMYDLYENISLVLETGNYISGEPRSLPPMFVSVPALHVEESRDDTQISKEIEDFINSKNSDGSKNEGFIYISFGTLVHATDLSPQMLQSFWRTMEAFPKIRFLWKWNGDFPKEKPDNLYVAKWFPQQDILSHPKIKGFVTQAGRPSVQEALSKGVPMIAFPVLGDQDFNSMRLQDIGAGVRLEITNLKETELIQAVNTVMYNETFKTRNKEASALFQDLPMKPRDTVIWWLEYVLRHDDLTHLKPMGRRQTWYQRRMLDVWFTIFTIGVAMITVVLAIGSLLVKYLLYSSTGSNGVSKSNGFVKHKAS